jgi:uracil-DNA glycosylase
MPCNKLDTSWNNVELIKNGFCEEICDKVNQLRKDNTIYPPQNLLLNALELLPFDKVKVVIIGQDPYHGEGQAHGLAFSVPNGIKCPPSLRNIIKEINNDDELQNSQFSLTCSDDFNLTNWAKQGVLLINSVLSVVDSKPASHRKKLGWENLTDSIIENLSSKSDGIVFMLWGNDAKKKKVLIDDNKHLILEAVHPSPLSANRGFFG